MQAHSLVLLLGLIALCTTPAGAQTTSAAPANIFLLGSQLQPAKAAATHQQKPIVLMYADPYATAPTRRYANTTYIDGLKTRAVIVIGTQPDKLPPLVAKDIRRRFASTPTDATTRAAYVAYVRPNSATDLPIVYLMDAACQRILFATNGSTEIHSRLKPIQQKIAEYTHVNVIPETPMSARTPAGPKLKNSADIPGLRAWKSSSGATINAAFVEASEGFITLKRGDGRPVRIMLQHLSEADQLYLASAHGIRPPEPEPEAMEALPTEETAPAGEETLPTEETPPSTETAPPTDEPQIIEESATSP
jgi:hypothetical protein